ncbi:hypothetical protein NKH77_08285 [Streptomyces sp. M19]
MGRPEKLIDPQDGPVARFAHELRKLRDEAGTPATGTWRTARVFGRDPVAGGGWRAAADPAGRPRLRERLPRGRGGVAAALGGGGRRDHELPRLPEEDREPPYRGWCASNRPTRTCSSAARRRRTGWRRWPVGTG